MKNILQIGLLSFLLSSCGGDIICDCFDGCDDAISFTFNTDINNNGFKPDETDTLIVYKLAKGQPNIIDSLMFTITPHQFDYTAVVPGSSLCAFPKGLTLSHGSPFSGDRLGDFDYIISIPELKTYKLTNLEIEGYTGGECSCYVNTKKLVTVDGVNYDQTDRSFPENAIVLSK